MTDEVAKALCRRFDKMKSRRATWESHWEEIAERVLPRQSGLFHREGVQLPKGEKKTEVMFDATAALNVQRFAAAMETMLTPRNSVWHGLQPTDAVLKRSRNVRLYFDDITRLLFQMRYKPRANFASQQNEIYTGLGVFGTGVQFIDAFSDGIGARYKTLALANAFFETNHQGVVDTCFRRYFLTIRQAVQRFGEERLSERLLGKLEKEPDEEVEFLQAVFPRTDRDFSRSDFRGMEFTSFDIEVDGKNVVAEGGFREFPFAVSRYVVAPEEIYGRSPAMLVLSNIKVLNSQKRTMLTQGHRVVDPVILAHDDGVLDSFSLQPGAINYGAVSKDGRRLVDVLPTGNLAAGQEMMDAERAVINDAFLVTLFQILTDAPQMTATEVIERAREKGALLSPTMGRQQTELLAPQITRELDVLSAQGLLPDPPEELIEADGEFDIEYTSPLSRAQRSEEAAGYMRALDFAMGHANVTGDPSSLDHFDMDAAMPEIMEIHAVPARWVSSPERIEEMREARARQAEMQQAIEAAPAVAGALKTANG